MRFINRRAQTVRRSRKSPQRLWILGCVLLQSSLLNAQTETFFPESGAHSSRPGSRVLPGGRIDRGVRSVWRFSDSDTANDPTNVAPVELEEPDSESPPAAVEEGQVTPVNFLEETPPAPGFFFNRPAFHHGGHPWPSRRIPNMMGDFFGAGRERLVIAGDQLLTASPSDVFDPTTLGTGDETTFLVVDPGSSVLGRQKPSENNSPWTRDRVFLNYSYLANTSLQEGGVGVHRMVPGMERTFNEGMASWEIRLPVGITFDSESVLTGGASRDQGELGNLYLGTKLLLLSSNDFVVAGGLGGNFPTADDLRFKNTNSRELVRVENSAVHVMPYLSAAWTEDDGGWFAQSFLQLDYDMNGNPVLLDNGTELTDGGDFKDATYLYWDIALGYWLIKDRGDATISGIAPIMELHYNTALDTPDGVRSDSGIEFGVNRGQVEVVNLLLGVNFELASRHSLSIGYGTPIGGGDDEQFDSELRILLNCNHGGQ